MKKTLRSVVQLFLAILGTGFILASAEKGEPSLKTGDPGWVAKTMKKMSIKDKVGQMVVCSYSGAFVNGDDDSLRDIEDLIKGSKIGGLILFGGEPYETAYLLNHLQRLAKIPLLIAADLERGVGNQIDGTTLFPPLMALGAAGSEELAYDMGKITAIEGRALGIHMTYAPVADVNTNPDNPIINTRSIGEDPDMVGRLAQAFIRGCQTYGMIATAKHFPGHGDTILDSHNELPTINSDRARLDSVELRPFRQAIAGGVQAIMTAHVSVPALDPTPSLPATLSHPIMTDLLRKEMGFQGLLITDAIQMRGIQNAYTDEEAALISVRAGADILLMPQDAPKVIHALSDAVHSGRIPISRIDESVKRILSAKTRLGLQKNRFVSPESLFRSIGPKRFLERAYQAFESAATLVKNEGNLLPLSPEKKKIAVFSMSSDPGDYFAGQGFVNEMRKRTPGLQAVFADGDTGKETLYEAAVKAASADVVIFAIFSRLRAQKGSVDVNPTHVELVKALAAGRAPVVVISFGSPYFLRRFPEVAAYLCLYRNTPQTQEIAAKALFGEMDVTGKLPVSLPGLFPIGHGIQLKIQ